MPFSIQTNVNSLIAQENLRVNSNFQSQTIQRLTSGYRINNSGDDAAGLAIANKFRNDTAELSQGVRNANDGISTLQIIVAADNIPRCRTTCTLAAQSASDAHRRPQRVELDSRVPEIDRQAQSIGWIRQPVAVTFGLHQLRQRPGGSAFHGQRHDCGGSAFAANTRTLGLKGTGGGQGGYLHGHAQSSGHRGC
jgi:hypothetical protein